VAGLMVAGGLHGCAAGTGSVTAEPNAKPVTQPGRRDLPTGLSAWVYAYGEVQVGQIRRHDAQAPGGRKFRYLFPYAGSVEFGKNRTFSTYYSAETSRQYATALGSGILLLPIFDGRQDHGEFEGWSSTEYEAFAGKVAAHILSDPNAAGVQIDIEPFRDTHLLFYEALGRLLRAQGRLMTGFISPGRSDDVLRRMYRACDIVVLSGYDFELPTPDRYGAALEHHLAKCHRIAKEAGGLTMVGIPAAGSWAEHEYTGEIKDGVCVKRESGFTQPQWLAAALAAVAAHEADDTYRGVSLWALSGRTKGEPGECLKSYQPDYIQEACWTLLRTPR